MLFATIGLNAISLVFIIAPALAPAPTDGVKADELVGVYEIIAGEKFGVEEPKDRIEGSTVRFTRDRVVVVDKEEKEVYGATYKLQSDKTADGACKITLVSKLAAKEDSVAHGLIEKKDGKVRLIYAIQGGDDPTDFKTKDRQLMFVLKKKSS